MGCTAGADDEAAVTLPGVAFFDLPLTELTDYRPPRDEPVGFDAFWAETLDGARARARDVVADPVADVPAGVDAWDLTFSGFDGDPVRGWLVLPAGAAAPVGGVVKFAGYSGGRGELVDHLGWAGLGLAVLAMDSRAQGWVERGATGDPHGTPGPAVPGLMTRGIEAPATLYHRRLLTDAVRAVETLRAHPRVDAARVGVTGASQGGGIALAAAALADDVAAAVVDVPFMCHFRRAVRITDRRPYGEIRDYLALYRDRVEQVFSTLDHVDGLNMAVRARCPALFSVGLMDLTCPPSTVFAAYNHWAGAKELAVYEFNDHEGGGAVQAARGRRFLRDHLAGGARRTGEA